MRLFVDSWGWLTLADRLEKHHPTAARFYGARAKAPGRIVTSDFVLDETFTRLFRRAPFDRAWGFVESLVDSIANGAIAVERVTEQRFRKTLDLRRKFRDKPRISFTDLSSMVIMQELRIVDVLTADAHFRQVDLGFRVLPE